jgi:7-cyano-7-deazaguanine reductase
MMPTGPTPPGYVSMPLADTTYGDREIQANKLEAWPNKHQGRSYNIHFEIPEFTCLCPRSGFPDFATIVIDYIPGASLVELKTLKLYINSFRDMRISHENATNKILNDLIDVLEPRFMRVIAYFGVRGNIATTITAMHTVEGYVGDIPEVVRPTFRGF